MTASQVWARDREFAANHRPITLSDTVDLPQEMVIYSNAAGDISVVDHAGVTIVYTVVAGQMLPVVARRINATGTTVAAASLVGLY